MVTRPSEIISRPILLADGSRSVNHRVPSGPLVIPQGLLSLVGTAHSLTSPVVEIRPIAARADSVNQRAPSGPKAIPLAYGGGWAVGSGTLNAVTWPSKVMRPI